MNTFYDLVTDLFTSLRDRLRNSFLSAFTIAFLLSNWQSILYILYSDKAIEMKIERIKDYYTSPLTLIIIPLSFTIFYVIILPYLMWGIDILSSKGIEGRKIKKHDDYLSELDRKIDVAEKQYRLEQEKTGFREQSELRKESNLLKEELELTKSELEKSRREKNNEQVKRQEIEEELRRSKSKGAEKKTHVDIASNNITVSNFRKFKIHLSESEQQSFNEAFDNFSKNRKLYEGFALLEEISSESKNVFDYISKDLINQYVQWGIIKVELDEYAEFTAKGKFFWNRYVEIQESGDI